MKRALWLVLLLAGCGNSESSPADLGVPDAFVGDLANTSDFFVGRYECLGTLDQYCDNNGCIRQLADADKPDAGCVGVGVIAQSCGSYVYITSYYPISDYTPSGDVDGGTQIQHIMVYDVASGELVAVLGDGLAGNSDCIAGPNVFVDPGILQCSGPPTDPTNPSGGSAPVQICAPVAEFPPCGGPLIRGGVRPAKCA